LALGGGGARGAAEVGVLQVFKEEGIPIDIVAGTSIGAVVGGLYVAGVPLEKLAGEFEHATFMKEFMPMPLVVQLLFTPLVFGPRLFGIHPYDGLYEGKKMIGIADKLAGDDRNTVEKLPIPFAAVCTNLMTGRSHRITSGDLGIAMEASTAVPGIKRPVQIGDQLYCDGGLSCNLPVQHVREMGADFIIAVDIDENLKQVPLKNFRKLGSVGRQALRIQLANTDIPALKEADFVIHPDTDGITLISRSKKDGRRGVQAGVVAARAAMPELKRRLAEIGVIVPGRPAIKEQ